MAIADNGKGIKKQDQEKIFNLFSQVEGHTKRPGGIGIGLSVCRHIVSLHGGRIAVDSQPGKGSRFTVTFPSRPLHPVEPVHAESAPIPEAG